MRDLFDDFMEELRKREAQARGETPPRPVGSSGPPDDGDDPADDAAEDPDEHDPDEPEPIDRTRAQRRPTGVPPRRPPGGPRDGAAEGGRGRRIGVGIVLVAIVAVFLLLSVGIDLWTDAIWYRSIGFDSVFWTRIGAQVALVVLGIVVALVVLLGNLWVAGRLTPPPGDGPGSLRRVIDRVNDAANAGANLGGQRPTARPRGPSPFGEARPTVFELDDIPDLTPYAGFALGAFAIILALGIGGSLGSSWETVLLWIHRVPFSPDATKVVTDPVFNRDIGYFLFDLPFLKLVQGLVSGLIVTSIVLVLARYLVGAMRGGLAFSTPVRMHLAVLGGLFLLTVAFGYQLDKYGLVYSTRGFATGVGYTDQHAQFFAFDVLTVISGIAAVVLIGGALVQRVWPLALTVGVWFLASIVIGTIYPEAIQRFTVLPNQASQEAPFIANNIAMTRLAYGLDTWEDDHTFGGNAVLTQQQIDGDADTFRNARLWDYRPLKTTLDQLQTIRKYYDFTDVDTDRYVVGGVQRQVMLSARELALEQNSSATGWVNQRITYTHGIGAVMVPVNEVVNAGQPNLFIGNVPPTSVSGAPTITQPRIYFGERSSSYVIVGARQPEFDYPTGEGDVNGANGTTTNWTGTSGIKLDTGLTRLLYALRFRDLNLLISDQVTASSQLLFHRSLNDRLNLIAPFLRFDSDPYLVVSEGRLVYMQDAYTVSDRFPNAQPFDPSTLNGGAGLGADPIDYIRNSVKITMDAYDGTMHFYVSDPSDPIIRAYQGVFPSLFEPLTSMPADLQSHLRVPEALFNVQTAMYGRYHVTDPQQFYRTDDIWTVPEGSTSEQTLPSEAYYVIMRMPGESSAEFLLLQPMVPKNRPNMIAWVAARMDAPNYGVTRVYRFPADTTIFGPAQIEARIDQDPLISQQITLWSQAGSTVIRGNLIVVPVGDSLIYLQPVYLQSTGSAFPEFQRIVVASPRQVVWGEGLGQALGLLLKAEAGNAPGPSPSTGPSPSPGSSPTPSPTTNPNEPLPTDIPGLIQYAKAHFDQAQLDLRAGDFAGYGIENAKVQAALDRLDQLSPGASSAPAASPSLSPSPSPSPAP